MIAPNEGDEGIRKLNQWALEQLERTRRAVLATPNWPDITERDKQVAVIDLQIDNLRKKLGVSDG